MKLLSLITSASIVGIAASVDMSRYSARSGVDAGFQSFLKQYVISRCSFNCREQLDY